MKKKYTPLSISGFLALILLFSACKSGFLALKTSVALETTRVSAVNLTEKRVLIVSYDSELSQEFVISLKNYVKEELKNHSVVVERINIRHNETAADMVELDKLKITFAPDYMLSLKVRDERVRKMYLIGSHVKMLRGMALYFNLFPIANADNEGTFLWRSTAVVNHFYNSENVSIAKKVAKELGIKMQKDLIIN